MNSWPETIALSKPLRDVFPRGRWADTDEKTGAAPASEQEQRQEALDAQYQRGLADGEKALTEKLFQQRAEMHELAQGILESLRKAVPQVIRDTENTMVSLALAVAQKLVGDLPVCLPMVEAAVRDALVQVEGTAEITVRLHKDDLELLQKSGSTVLKNGQEAGDFRFLASPDVTRGGCLVETNFGTIDARRETKFELLKRSLTE